MDIPASFPSILISKKTLLVIFGPLFSSAAKEAGMEKRAKRMTAKRMLERFIILYGLQK